MLESKIKILSDTFQNSKTMFIISDAEYNVLWCNNSDFALRIEGNSLKKYVNQPVDPNKKSESIISVSIDNCNFSMCVLPIFENDKLEGFIIKFITVSETLNHWINRDYAESQIAFFAYLRTQVSGIISAATVLHDSLEATELYDELKILNRQVNYCFKILASLLNPAEISKYAFEMHNIVRLNASVFIKDILSIIDTLLRGNNITIEYTCDDDVFINIDTDRFVAVILNLLLNSIQYNIEEEKIIKVSLKKSENECIFSVTDNGYGISQEKMSVIFGTTECTNSNFEEESKKQKLGHRIFDYFCRTFNATMFLTSKENVGTTVSFKMPLSIDDTIPNYAESKTADYLTNRFSNIYIAISSYTQINYF